MNKMSKVVEQPTFQMWLFQRREEEDFNIDRNTGAFHGGVEVHSACMTPEKDCMASILESIRGFVRDGLKMKANEIVPLFPVAINEQNIIISIVAYVTFGRNPFYICYAKRCSRFRVSCGDQVAIELGNATIPFQTTEVDEGALPVREQMKFD